MKIAGSYASLLRGVSQQPAEVRVAGQHTEQVNMLPDPVTGLTRRRGTIFQHGSFVPVNGTLPYDADFVPTTGTGYRKIEHKANGTDYVILMREEPQGGVFTGDSMPPVMCYNRTSKEFIGVSWGVSGGSWETMTAGQGIAAAVSIGQYVVWSLRSINCDVTSTQQWGQAAFRKGVAWIRGGVYSRTYTVFINGTAYSYTTPASTVAGSEANVRPENIAAQIGTAMTAGGVTGVAQVGSHICYDLSSGQETSSSDSGDGSLMRATGLTLDSTTKLPLMSVPGHIVKIQPSADSWFYVQAVAKAASVTTLQEVIWRECAGEVQGATLYGLGTARVYDDTLYIGMTAPSDPTGLGHMPGGAGTNPSLVPSISGDSALNKAHRWMKNRITYLGVFQDRLLIGSGAALSISAAGDYLNFFRSTMTTVAVNDGFEVVPQGGEDDVLKHGVTYNKNLVIFGDKRQYLIPGTTPLVPTSPNMSIMTVYANAAECQPVAAGGQIYYVRNREGWASVHQIQPGQYVDSAESFPASAQVGNYIPAPAVEIEAIPGVPAMLVIRSRTAPSDLFVFSYIDLPDGRKQDAWQRLTFHAECGYLMGMHSTPEGLLLFWARKSESDGQVYRVCDLLPLSAKDNDYPYLDSMRTRASIGYAWPGLNGVYPADPGSVVIGGVGPNWKQAFKKGTRFLYGEDFTIDGDTALRAISEATASSDTANVVGLPFDATVTLTNPYARDGQGQPILNGRTTVTNLAVNTKDSAGMAWDLTAGGVTLTREWSGRQIGGLLSIIGVVPVLSARVPVAVGRETREYTLTLKARKWYPLNLAGIDWTGQSFNRTPRASSGGG